MRHYTNTRLPYRYILFTYNTGIYLMEYTMEVFLFDGHELTVGHLGTQHSTVTTHRVFGTRYRQTETTYHHQLILQHEQ